jgi:hypothetical protein
MLPATLKWEATLTGDDPDQQVADTISLMTRYVCEDSRNPTVIKDAATVAPPGVDPIEAVFWHVKQLIRFQHDERTAEPLSSRLSKMGLADIPVVEVLIRPVDMVTWREDTGQRQVGDCDDYAMLTAALLMAHGIRSSFVTAAADPRIPGQFSHVYVAAYPGSGRIALDTSHGQYPGWEVSENVTRRQEWPMDAGLRDWIVAGLFLIALWPTLMQMLLGRRRRAS